MPSAVSWWCRRGMARRQMAEGRCCHGSPVTWHAAAQAAGISAARMIMAWSTQGLTALPADRAVRPWAGALSRDRAGMSARMRAASSAHACPRSSLTGWSWPVRLATLAPAGASAYESVTCSDASVTCAGTLALSAGVFGVVLMADSFDGTRSTDRLRRLSRVSALNLHSQTKTSNIFLENMVYFKGDELEFPDQPRPGAALHRPRPGRAAARPRGQPGHHRAQRPRHPHRPGHGRLRAEAERWPAQPPPDPGPPPAARTHQPGTRHRRGPGPPRRRQRRETADQRKPA